ncbi:MAG: flagellar export chaperone FliS [Nevskiales bacterium]|nr:flagellar export chaperone FliS [Nevskiales bacterium]
MSYAAAVRQYQHASAIGSVEEASPHKLIEMLYAGVLERLAIARGAMERGQTEAKLRAVASALEIVEHLRLSLDMAAGGEIARNLESLYDYIGRRLLEANVNNDPAVIDEIAVLTRQLKAGWDAIGH